MQYARAHKLKYTRYADDLTFSSTSKQGIMSIVSFSEAGEPLINPNVSQAIEINGFIINKKKTGVFGRGTRQVVTGIVVNKKCNFRREDYRYLRNLFHYWGCTDANSAAKRYAQYDWGRHYYSRFFSEGGEFCELKFISHIHGLLSYYEMIAQANKRPSWPLKRLWTSFYDLTKCSVPDLLPERFVFRTDSDCRFRVPGTKEEEEYGVTGTAFITKRGHLVTARHCLKNPSENAVNAIYNNDSVFEVGDVFVEYDSFRDDYLYDWAICPVPDEFKSLPGLAEDADYSLQEGEVIIAYGYADGKNQLRKIRAQVVEILENEIVVDRAFIKGMSGGPVLNVRGRAIGLITKGSGNGEYDRDGRFILLSAIPHYSKGSV